MTGRGAAFVSKEQPSRVRNGAWNANGDVGTPPKRSMRRAIDEKCRDCCFDPLDDGNWRQQVGACEITTCALWEFRPRSRPRAARPDHDSKDPF